MTPRKTNTERAMELTDAEWEIIRAGASPTAAKDRDAEAPTQRGDL